MTYKRLQVGITMPTYYNGFSPFLNWWKTASPYSITRTAGGGLSGKAVWDAGTYLAAATGEIVNPAPADLLTFTRIFLTKVVSTLQVSAGCDYALEPFVVEWDGAATVAVVGNLNAPADASIPNKLTFTMASPASSNYSLTFTITNVNNPPRNIRVYQARYASNVANGERFNPDWLAEIAKFGTVRFMDWQATNNSDVVHFTDLADVDYYAWCSRFGTDNQSDASDLGPKGSVHPQLICEFAQLTGCNVHVCMPVKSTDAFVTSFATYMKANCTTKVTYEYSNECWHGGFRQAYYCNALGAPIWGKNVTGITPGNPTTFTVPSHGMTTGQSTTLYIRATGYEALYSDTYPDVSGAVTVINGNSFTMAIDTTGYPAFSGTDSFLITPTSGAYDKWYGYRGAQIMKIVRDIYNDRSRWGGCINTQAISTSHITDVFTGIDYWISENASPLVTSDLFNDGYTAPYFGPTVATSAITGITKANPAVVTSAGHPYVNGQRVKLFVAAGMTELNSTFATVANKTSSTFELSGVNSTGYTTYAAGNNFAVDAKIWDLMDESNTKFVDTPLTYPTKYTYFNQQMADLFLTGSCDIAGLTISLHIEIYSGTYIPASKSAFAARGLGLRQYEANCALIGDTRLTANGGEPQFNEYVVANGHSAETAAVYAESYRRYIAIGVVEPSKFLADGTTSYLGTWAGVRFWPLVANGNTDDTGNPVWLAVSAVRDGPVADPYTVNW
jgi:hypothetical protein